MEIERKFLVKEIPEHLNLYHHNQIIQGYIPTKEPGVEKRVRKKGNKYSLTIKSAGSLVRSEQEIEIPEKRFLSLWKMTEGRRIEKTRYDLPYDGKKIELDIYSGNLEGLVVAEVEFNSEQEAESFVVPNWFGEEVTYNNRYRNKNLALKGRPD